MEAPATIRESWLETERSRIHYVTAGDAGSSVVLLHGGGTDASRLSWKHTLPLLARSRRVYAPDWPGYGESSPMRGEYTTEALIDLLEQMLERWRLERPVLVGLSMGGGAALGLTLRRPELPSGLVLVDSFGLHPRVGTCHPCWVFLKRVPFVVRWFAALLRRSRALTRFALGHLVPDRRHIDDELVDDVHVALQSSSAVVSFIDWQMTELSSSGFRTCYADRLGEVRVPTLVVHGKRDHLVPVEAAVRAAERIPEAKLGLIENCGHWPPRDRPEAFHRALLAFLDEQ